MSLIPTLNQPTTNQARVPAPLVANDLAIQAVVNGDLDHENLADGGITTAKLAAGAVTPAKQSILPACAVYNNAALSIPNNSATTVTLNAEYFDTATMHDTSTLTQLITFTTLGVYLVVVDFLWAAHATGVRTIANSAGGTVAGEEVLVGTVTPGAANAFNQRVTGLLSVGGSGGNISFTAYQNSGGALGMTPYIAASYLGRAA